jgi:Arylsulfotransferase (ASST)
VWAGDNGGLRREFFTRLGLAASLTWAAAAAVAQQPDADAERVERLGSLPYATWSPEDAPADARAGVTRYVRERAWPGLNLYALPNRGEARLVDMEGRLVHTWATGVGQPGRAERVLPFFLGWQHVAMAEEGGLFAIVNRDRLLRLDPTSAVSWSQPLALHHDLFTTAGGGVHTIVDTLRVVERSGRPRLVIDNELVSLDARGRVERRLSMVDALRSHPVARLLFEQALDRAYADFTDLPTFLARSGGRKAAAAQRALADPRRPELDRAFAGELPAEVDRGLLSLLREIPGSPADRLHTNGLVVLDRHVAGLGAPGDILVSVRNLDLLVVVEPKTGRVRWTWGPGQVQRQHQPSVLPNGHVLLFDNRPGRGRSRVVEMAPESGAIVWSYEGSERERFFSRDMGGCQGLPNGNVLIVESQAGRAFEVTRAGEIVWEFLNPERAGKSRAVLYRMERLPSERASFTNGR